MNRRGHAATLIHEPGNTRALRHAAYSPRAREGRAAELAAHVMELSPVAAECDRIACEELGALLAHAEAIDAALAESGPISAKGSGVRALLDIRLRVDRRIEAWVSRLGLDPASRARVARDLGAGSLAAHLSGLMRDE